MHSDNSKESTFPSPFLKCEQVTDSATPVMSLVLASGNHSESWNQITLPNNVRKRRKPYLFEIIGLISLGFELIFALLDSEVSLFTGIFYIFLVIQDFVYKGSYTYLSSLSVINYYGYIGIIIAAIVSLFFRAKRSDNIGKPTFLSVVFLILCIVFLCMILIGFPLFLAMIISESLEVLEIIQYIVLVGSVIICMIRIVV